MMELMLSIVSSVIFSGLLTATLIFLAKSWISQRLKSAIEHEYAQKLETYKAYLTSEHALALEELKTRNAECQAVQADARASFTASHIIGHEKKLQSLETFWSAIVQLRGATSTAAFIFLDIYLPEEYDTLLTNKNVTPDLDRLTEKSLTDNFGLKSSEIDKARLYAGEYIFALFWAYRAITGRIALKLMLGKRKGKIDDWAADEIFRRLIKRVFSSEEIAEFDKLKVKRIEWIRNQIEQKILTHSAEIISGEVSSRQMLEQAKEIAVVASALEAENKSLKATW